MVIIVLGGMPMTINNFEFSTQPVKIGGKKKMRRKHFVNVRIG